MRCLNCAAEMTVVDADRHYGRTVPIDVCRSCQLIWFDQAELLQLAPGGTLQLIALLSDDAADGAAGARQPLKRHLACPRCRRVLDEVHDSQRGTSFTYARCPDQHGRALTFYQFLRAKGFVRTLGAAEVEELRRHVRQVNCVNCGAPVNVGTDAACQFCRTPVAVLDPAQLRKAVEDLKRSLEQKPVDVTLPLTLALEKMRADRVFDAAQEGSRRPAVLDLFFGVESDPMVGGLRALARLLRG